MSGTNEKLQGLKVLVIDDSKTIRRTAETLLAKEGCEVFTAIDGFDALAKIADHQPDIVFVDIMMPRLDGYQTCSLIKHNKVFRSIPVIMLSSKDGLFDRARGRIVGSEHYLTKPFTKDELLGAIETHVGEMTAMALILIVDDSPTEVHVMQKALEKHGYRTAAAADGAEGIRLAREMSPDLIFMDIVMPGMNGYQATRTLASDPQDPLDPHRHGDLQGAGDRSHLGPAAGRHRLHGQARVAGSAGRQGAGDPGRLTMSEEVSLKPLRDRPFELLAELERRGRAVSAQLGQETAAGREWVGVALRMAGELFLVAREETREVLSMPSALTRVPGAKGWVKGLANVRGQLLPIIDLRQFLGSGVTPLTRNTRIMVVNHREIPAGLIVDEVLGFRRFAETEFSGDAPPTVVRCDRYLAGAFRRGPEQWPVLSLRAMLESSSFSEAAA